MLAQVWAVWRKPPETLNKQHILHANYTLHSWTMSPFVKPATHCEIFISPHIDSRDQQFSVSLLKNACSLG